MKITKKVLVAGMSALAGVTVGVGISTPLTYSLSSKNSSSVSNPIGNYEIASLPSSDEFTYQVSESNVVDSSTLNTYLSNLFKSKDVIGSYSTYFSNNKEYKNVTTSYVEGSANYENSTFIISVTPTSQSKWENTEGSKTVIVTIKNLDKNSRDASATETNVTLDVATTPVSNDGDLNTYLKSNFNSLKSHISGTYENVDVAYKDNSANYNDANFRITVTPKSDHAWSNGSTESKDVTVSLTKMAKLASAENVTTYNDSISKVTNSTDLNTYLKTNFDSSKLNGTLSNVDITFVDGSAKTEGNTFKVNVTPKSGFVWSNGEKDSKEFTVTTSVTLNDAIAPASTDNFTSSISSKEVTNNSTFNAKLTDLFKDNNNLKKLSGTYTNVSISYVSNSASYNNSQFKISVTPTSGHAWSDGSKDAKTITITASSLSKTFDEVSVTRAQYLSYISGTPNIKISNNTNETVTYTANYTVATNSPYAWTTYWSVSEDGGKTWATPSNSNLQPSVILNKTQGKAVMLRFQIVFSINHQDTIGYSMTFTALSN